MELNEGQSVTINGKTDNLTVTRKDGILLLSYTANGETSETIAAVDLDWSPDIR